MSFNFLAAVTICSDFGAQENNLCHYFQFFPIYLQWNFGTGYRDLHVLNVKVVFFFFLFFSFIFVSWRLITMLSWVLSYIDMN